MSDRDVLITGAGTLGTALAEALLHRPRAAAPDVLRLVDHSEQALFQAQRRLHDPRIRWFLKDVSDYDDVDFALRKPTIVVHTAACKFIEVVEYNPLQSIRTDLYGTYNVVKAAINHRVRAVLYTSTDKAVAPCSLYGHLKAAGEHLLRWAHTISDHTKFYTLRLPNFRSAGSVFDIWADQHEKGLPLTLTSEDMYRYYIELPDAVAAITDLLSYAMCDTAAPGMPNTWITSDGHQREGPIGGELFIPRRVKRYRMLDLLRERYPDDTVKTIGLRPGERLREPLMTPDERKRREAWGDDLWVIR